MSCPCGLWRHEVDNLDNRGCVLLDSDGLCRNVYADGSRNENGELRRCGMPLGAHQHQPASVTIASTDRLQVKLFAKQYKIMAAMLALLEEIGDKDCYDRISSSSKPRELTIADYESAYLVPVSKLQCMVTGVSHESIRRSFPGPDTPKNPVILTHLLARNAGVKERLSLGYKEADIENIRNSVLICKGIKEAFNNKFISFVPLDQPFASNRYRYKLHVWVDAVRGEPIFEGSTQTIGLFDGAPLNLTVGTMSHDPFKRAISYQAFRAVKKWGKGFSLKTLPATAEDSDTSVYLEMAYKSIKVQYAMQLAKDIAEDEDEDETAI